MKLRLPSKLVAAIMAAASSATFATLATGSTSYGATTYDDLTTSDYFETNANVYNTGKGTFYLETDSCALNLTLTLNLNDFAAYQAVHDYANGGYYSPFVTWTYNNNAGATYGMADVSSGYSSADYSGITGMWAGSPWTTNNKVTTDTLRNYADADGNVTLTINNDPTNTTRNVVVTAANGDTLYSADGLRSSSYTSQHITSFTVNMNYVKSVTLNSNSILDSSNFTAPKDYTIAFDKTRTESVGRIVFLGDSITHGVEDMSWRWGLFKTFVDNGIENEIAGPLSGYHSTPLNGDYNGNFSSSTYGGATFDNAHYAQSSGRTHNMLLASSGPNALGNSTGVNYGGVTSAKVGNEYNGDTYIMMMGTNDILSDGANTPEKMASVTNRLLGAGEVQGDAWSNAGTTVALVGNYSGAWGTMGQIIDNMQMDAGDTMYVMSIPTWAEGRQNIRVYAPYVAEYNEKLELWTKAYSDTHTGTIKYVDVNRGLIDKTLGGDFLGPNSFFRQVGGDYLHPNEQGALIIAGNLAQGMGLAGRTAGLHRADSHTANTEWVSGAASYTINAGQSVTIGAGELDTNGGYTVDFSAVFGNGATDGWLDKSNALSVSVGDGANVGTLKLSEGYISWGDKLLFCQDNSVQGNDNIRIVYHTGDSANQVGNGYYVWLGDMLIGQALSGSTGTLSGITLSSVGATGTVSGLTYSNTAYAPLSNGIASESNAFYATISKVMTSHDSAPIAGPTDFSQATTVGKTGNAVYGAASNEGGDVVATYGNAISGSGSWFAGQGVSGVEHTGNISLQVTEGASGAGMFGVVNTGTADGNVTVQVDGASLSSYTGGAASIIGAYAGNITGTFTAVMNSGTLSGGILGGFENAAAGNSIGSVDLIVNGGTVGGAILGGSKVANGTVDGTIGISVAGGTINGTGGENSIAIIGSGTAGTVNGDIDITISGGVIKGDIVGKQATGVTYGEGVDATVTVQGNKASITGNITADTVKLKDVAASEYSDGFDKYAGTITAANLELDNYTAGLVNATLVTDYVTVSNGTNAIIRGLHLRNCSIDADATSLLTLGGDIHSGNTISYTGNLYLEDGIRFTIDTPTDITVGDEGFSNGKYIYKVADEGTGHLYAVDGTALTYAHTSTFTGTDGLAGMRFAYDAATGALIAHTADATYKIATSTVNYSDIPSAGSVTMSGGQLNLDTALNAGVTIAATGGTVSVGEGVQFNTSALSGSTNPAIVNNGGTVTLDNAAHASALLATITGNSGTIKLADGIDVTINGTSGLHSHFGGVLDIGSATLKLGNGTGGDAGNEPQFDSFSSIHINGGTLRLMGWGCDSHQSKLIVEGESSLVAQQHGNSGGVFNINGVQLDAALNVYSGTTKGFVVFSDLSGRGNLNVLGSSTNNVAQLLRLSDMSAYTGNVNVAPTRDGSAVTLEMYTGNGDVEMGTLSASNHSTVKFLSTNNHEFTVSGLTATGANAVVNIGNGTAATKVTIDGALAGTVNVLANSTLTLGDNFSAESATIAGAGYVDVHMKGTDEKHYSHGENGYLSATIDLTDYQNKVTFNNTGWKVDGAANSGATFNSETYKLSVAESNVFYVNTTVNQADVTTTAVLVGTGTYALGDGVNALSSNVTLGDAENWQGTVKVTNVALDAAESKALSTLGNANSTVELTGVTKYDRHWANTFGDQSANIRLTDDGDTLAWVYSGGGAGSLSYYMNNTGKWSGEGTFKVDLGTLKNGFRYAGDISEWTGTFLMASGESHLTLGGDAAEVNAAIRKEGGTLELRLERDVTFNNTVTVNKITASGHAVVLGSHGEGESATHGNLTLSETSTMDSLTLNDGAQANLGSVKHNINTLTINDGSSVTTSFKSGGDGFIKGNVNVNAGGTLWLNRDDTLGWGNNSTTAINMEGAEGKLATMKVSDKQTFSTTLNLNGYTNVINGDGSSDNKGLEIFQNGSRIGTINATGTHNTIATGVFLRSKGTITTAEGAELTISGDVKAGVAGGNAEMVKEGAGTLTLSGDNSFGGNLTVNAGTIVMGSSHALGAANNTGSRTITINSGATIDLHGTDDRMYKYTLAGGSLVNNGSGTNTGHLQTMGLVLTDDSIIGGTGDYHLINSNYGNTAVDLGGHTLTKTGSNTIGFYSTAVSGAAGSKLRIEGGALNFTRNARWNQTFTSLDADLEVAKSDSSAVNGEFIMAAGHTISSTEVGGSVNAAIQLAGSTTLHTDGVNSLTLNGVLSNGADATGSVTKTGVGTVILNAANTYTGTTTIDAGALVASNSNALSHSVLSFSDMTEAESPYRIFAFAENLRFNNTTHALEDAGTQIDGTIKGLDGHRGYVVAKTLTIDVGEGEEYAFMHRYDAQNQTTDRVEMKVDRLVKTGAGTQVIGGDYSEARGFTTNGLVINNGVEVQQGTLHMMTRGVLTANFDVRAGATLKTTDDVEQRIRQASAVQYKGSVTLHGTEGSAATLDYTNGSTNIAEGLYVDGYGQVFNRYNKFQYINGLYNAEGTTENDISFIRKDTDNDIVDQDTSAIVLTDSGNFAGTVHLSSESVLNNGSNVHESYGIQMLGEAAQTALANAVVSFEGDNVTVLSFRNSDMPVGGAYWDSHDDYGMPMDGTVGGLQGTNGSVYAATLTINAADGADYTYGGALNVTGLTKTGTGTQTLNGDLSAFNADLTVNAGTLVITGTTLPQTGSADEGKRGTLNLNGGTLKIGNGDGNETSLSSFSAVNFAGGVLHYNNKKDTLHNVTVAADTDSRIYSYDMGNVNDGSKLLLAGDTTMNGNLTLCNYWNAAFEVEHLTGAGTLAVTGADDSGNTSATTAQDGTYTINSLVGFTGNLSFSSTGARATINTNGSTDRMGTLTVANRSEVTVNSGESTFEATTLAISGNPNYAATVVTFNGAGANFSGNIATTGNGTINVNGTAPLTANTISLTAGTTLNFDQKVTLTLGGSGRNRPELLFNNETKAATQVNFNGGYAYTGSNGYALCIGKDVTVSMGGTSTLGTDKAIGLAGGATLTLQDNASLSVGILNNSTTPGNNGTVNVGASATLAVTGTSTNRITDLHLGNASTTSFNSTTSLETLSVDGTTANLALKNDGGALTVQKLLGGSDATLELYAEKQTGNLFKVNMGDASLSYTDDNLFSGNLWVTSHSNQGQSARSAINMAVKAEDVLKNATVNLSNWKSAYNNTRVIMSLESDAKVAGINSANTGAYAGAGSYIRSGAMTNNTPNDVADMASTGDTARTLEITGSGEYSTNAHVMENVNIKMSGSGTQNFSGDVSRFNGTIAVNNGTLAFTGLSRDDTNNLHVSTATVSGSGKLKAGSAVLEMNSATPAMLDGDTPAPTGTLTNATFTSDSLSGKLDETNKGVMTNSVLDLTELTSYTIKDMNLVNSGIFSQDTDGHPTTEMTVSNVSLDATSYIMAKSGSTLSGENRLTLSAGEGIEDGVTVESSQLTGLTLTNGSNLTLDLSAHGYAAGAKIGDKFTIELSDFSWKYLEDLVDSSVTAAKYGTDTNGNKLNDIFKVLALGSTDTYFNVISVAQGVSGGEGITLEVQVPEPTTSVLSLLALAGMAARRRRK